MGSLYVLVLISDLLRYGPVVDGFLYPSFKHTRKSNVLDFESSVAVVLESVRELDKKEVVLWTMEAVSDEVF